MTVLRREPTYFIFNHYGRAFTKRCLHLGPDPGTDSMQRDPVLTSRPIEVTHYGTVFLQKTNPAIMDFCGRRPFPHPLTHLRHTERVSKKFCQGWTTWKHSSHESHTALREHGTGKPCRNAGLHRSWVAKCHLKYGRAH